MADIDRRRLEAADEELTALRVAKRDLIKAEAARERAEHELVETKREHMTKLQDVEQAMGWALASSVQRPLRQAEFSMKKLDKEDPLFRIFTRLVTSTCASHRAAFGSDEFCKAPQLQILGVELVSNPVLSNAYLNKAEEIIGLRRQGCQAIPGLSHLKVKANDGIAGSVGIDLNEHFLFHGASDSVINEICKGGFDPRRGGESVGSMFGVATYLAANSSKADIYTESFSQRSSRQSQRKLIVARALLGESHRTAVKMPYASRPPDGNDGQPMDSVWADTRVNGGAVDHLEVMFYDKGQAYPQAVVTYRHEAACACAECRKRPED